MMRNLLNRVREIRISPAQAALMAASQAVGFGLMAFFLFFRGIWSWDLQPVVTLVLVWGLFKVLGAIFAGNPDKKWSIIWTVMLGIAELLFVRGLWKLILIAWSPWLSRPLIFLICLILLQSQVGLWIIQRKLWDDWRENSRLRREEERARELVEEEE